MPAWDRLTICRVPLLAVDRVTYISESVLDLGLDPAILNAWRRVCEQIRRYVVDGLILDHWPSVVMYATGVEAAYDQYRRKRDAQRMAGNTAIRGWSVFDDCHERCWAAWGQTDRTIVHLNALGGDVPLTRLLLHEVGHHRLHQRACRSFTSQLTETTEKLVENMVMAWLQILAPWTRQDDHPEWIRAIELLVAERRQDEPGRI